MKIWKKLQILKSFIYKKIDFLPPKISQMMSYTPKTLPMCSGKSRDTITYQQNPLWTPTSSPKNHNRKCMDFMKMMKIWKNLQILKIFIAKKVQFPASEIFSDGCLHLQKHNQCAQGSLEISLHTYKINFGRLQAPLRFTIENFTFSWKMMKIWKILKFWKFALLKSSISWLQIFLRWCLTPPKT